MRCPKCNQQLYLEEEDIDYPLWCEECDENFYIFEGEEDYKNEANELYKKIDELQLKRFEEMINKDLISDELKREKYECIQSVPYRFRQDAYDCLEYSEDWNTIRKSWEYFLEEVVPEFTKEENEKYGFSEVKNEI